MEAKTRVLVTGANGQLGMTLRDLSHSLANIDFCFYSSEELNITDKNAIREAMMASRFDYLINCAAYTNVEMAEQEQDKAFLINEKGVENICDACKETDTVLIHISTDYVFDGNTSKPYTEEDQPNPINVYGKSKLAGENAIRARLEKYYIIRTSWLYSHHGKNFLKMVMAKISDGESLYVSSSQKGAPTSTSSLAKAIIRLIRNDKNTYGIFHFSNKGLSNWHAFANRIVQLVNSEYIDQLFEIQEYKTKAPRPLYSKLDSKKFEETFSFNIKHWDEELNNVIVGQL